jgi:hypothetical protein
MDGPGNALNISVIRGNSPIRTAVSLPLPVMFDHITLLGESMRRLSNPKGEIFTRPSAAAVDTKNKVALAEKRCVFLIYFQMPVPYYQAPV